MIDLLEHLKMFCALELLFSCILKANRMLCLVFNIFADSLFFVRVILMVFAATFILHSIGSEKGH